MIAEGVVVGGKYRLERQIGWGGMARVWAAVHETLGRRVAIKFIRSESASSGEQTERFLREARIASALRHRFVVDVIDVDVTDEGVPYIVMELLEGQTLSRRARTPPPMAIADFVVLIDRVLQGLSVAHRKGVVHRDLKPDNIILVTDEELGDYPKIVDFGISFVIEGGLHFSNFKRVTKEGTVLGTPAYMSPEQIRNPSGLDPRTDVYALGVIMYEVLSGTVPFSASSEEELLVKVLTEPARPLAAVRPELDRRLADAVDAAMSWDAAYRFADADEMRAALRGLETCRGVVAPPVSQTPVPVDLADAGWGSVDERAATVKFGKAMADEPPEPERPERDRRG